MRVAAALALALIVSSVSPAIAAETVVYLHPDSSDRYRPALDNGGPPVILANINSITPPDMSPEGWVAFSAAIGDESLGRYGVFLVRSDGSDLVQLTDGEFSELDPSWSPDGERIAVSQNQGGNIDPASCCRLAVVDVSNGNVAGLTGAVGATRPSFSNDGDYIVYDTPQGVWRISAGGGAPTLVAPGGYDASTSPDDGSIVYLAKDGPTTTEIRRVPAGGGASTVLLETTQAIENPFWVGDRVYFLHHGGLGYDGRKAVALLSVFQGGVQWRTERAFGEHVVGIGLGFDNDEFFFYRGDGLFRYYQIRPDGALPSPMVGGNGYTTGWSSIASVDLEGDGQDEMFFYRTDGLFRYYDIRPNGSLPHPMAAGTGYTTGWDAITALDLDGDGQDEMFFYRSDGVFRYYHIRSDGTLPGPLLSGDDYQTNWDVILAIDVDGDGQDEILFYRSDGQYRLHNISSSAALGPPIQSGNDLGVDWTSIAAVDLDGDEQDEIFFYRDDGSFSYRDIEPDGDIGQVILGGPGYTTGWSTITSVNLAPG